MTITFKDVGQGDSIILEWTSDQGRKIGIIDCNKKGRSNPVVKHIHDGGYTAIEFVVLTHPHNDHYSGLYQLLTYVETNNLTIKRFCNTLHWSATNYWKYFELGSAESRLLRKIVQKMAELKRKEIIRRIDGLGAGMVLKIEPDLVLECLAPAHDDVQEFQKLVRNNADQNGREASQAANFLSTVLKLQVGPYGVLFTADAEYLSFENIRTHQWSELALTTFQLCQLPHHGSAHNHHSEFWTALPTTAVKHAVISAGPHKKYNHPSFEVISALDQIGYSIHCTNRVNGMKEFIRYKSEQHDASIELDVASTTAEEYRGSNDQVFTLTESGFTGLASG